MTLTIEQWNPRDRLVGFLDLVNINTTDGDFGFIAGTDGVFTDINGKTWYGSTLISVPRLQSAIDGVAPSGSIEMSFIQDPSDVDVVGQIRELGLAYIKDRPISFYLQPIRSMSEFHAPTLPPELHMTRTMRTLTFAGAGAAERSITVGFEPWTEDRRSAKRIAYNTDGHAKLIGSANPSLSFMPTENFEEEKLFG
ncbi:hypothetical protein ACRARG_12545 [Pseudooceanicola sp. C21-150M6]|uniref:hypothetical protein n=1 Tax=Pseudooceanicola sp. C21-150M6 TaxID=3434355 RepID=UPI003D7FF5C0